MGKFGVIAFDIYKKNIKSGAFLTMLLFPFIIMGFVYAIGHFAGDAFDVDKIGVVSEQSSIPQQMKSFSSDDYEFTVVDSEEKAQKEMKDEKIGAYLVVTEKDNTITSKLYSETSLGMTAEMVVQQLLNTIQSSGRAQALGLTIDQVTSLTESASYKFEKVSFDEDGKMVVGEDNTQIQYWVSFATILIMFFIIMTYTSIIAQEIASEKGTRIMEVILSSTRASTHFFGKIVGILMVALTQIVVYGIVFAFGFPKIMEMDLVKQFLGDVSLENLFGSFLVFMVVFVFLGILSFSVLAALCGSLVNRVEDTAKAVLPVTYLGMAGYMIGIFFGMFNPNGAVIRVTSYIPFLSCYIMPVRLAYDTVTTSGALMSAGIMAVTMVLLTLFSAKLYKSNVLVYSEGGLLASLKQSISIMRNEKKQA